jgi:Na+-translocating ferredoxin:NAD+ oxidoreductase RnfG subunit
MKVLDNKETPGLGDKIVKDSAFVGEFDGVSIPLRGVKAGRATGAEEEVDMITGATISSEAVIGIVNDRLGELRAPLGSWWATGGAVTSAPAPSDGRTASREGVR